MDIYPAIDLKGGKCVRLTQGRFEETTVYSEDPLKIARHWQARTPAEREEFSQLFADLLERTYIARMDEYGVHAQVLYPNVGGFGSEHFLRLDNEQLKLVCVTAYNDFLLEWASADLFAA